MKQILSILIVLISFSLASAEVVMHCQLAEEDLVSVTIDDKDGVMTLTEVSKRGQTMISNISNDDFENQYHRLSDGRYGFRYLSLMYSDIFNEFDWFVESRGGFAYTISRAICQ